ncbi:aminoglycoside phosphotransferase (APT) family kinase protein [Kribbella amoyensis]|uniref:Aminoglycoside phosphotransferase (APT) family kinase protein n=1 Tax=Kribbella amoyensis TaxID=996641 RepID=A0A561BY05_9ACTN|nr:phosphotransferase [Kribbella amoyensis]TWD83721.1 aminoglycoside phosphotransferase (APT) family kinase protein [Kribbella amoyensis]
MDGFEAIAASAVPLTGGYGGETYAVSAAGEDAVLRLYVRHPERAVVDMALLRLVRGLLPVPRVLDAMPEPDLEGAPPYVLTERLPGINLERYLETAGDDERGKVGEQLGELLVRLSGMPFLRYGEFSGPDLEIRSFESDLLRWFHTKVEDLGLARDQVESLTGVIDRIGDLEATGADRICLVHSDFNPKNLLVDPETAELTGLIDWEFAHAGSPYTDLGNVLRFCTDPVLGSAVLRVVRAGAPGLGDRLEERGRAADLWALFDLAARSGQNPVTTAAHDLIRRIADTGDLSGGRPDLDVVH